MDISGKLPSSIQIRTESGLNAYKVATYASAVSIAARVDKSRGILNTEAGTEDADKARIWTEVDISSSTLVWFADEVTTDQTTGRKVKNKKVSTSLDGSQSLYRFDLE